MTNPTYFKVFRRAPVSDVPGAGREAPVLASTFWNVYKPVRDGHGWKDLCGFLYLQDYPLRSAAASQGYTLAEFNRETGAFTPPLTWGPFGAFDTLARAEEFAAIAHGRGRPVLEIWEVQGLPSVATAFQDPDGHTLAIKNAAIGTVLLDAFSLLRPIRRFSL